MEFGLSSPPILVRGLNYVDSYQNERGDRPVQLPTLSLYAMGLVKLYPFRILSI